MTFVSSSVLIPISSTAAVIDALDCYVQRLTKRIYKGPPPEWKDIAWSSLSIEEWFKLFGWECICDDHIRIVNLLDTDLPYVQLLATIAPFVSEGVVLIQEDGKQRTYRFDGGICCVKLRQVCDDSWELWAYEPEH